jgi:hypothetical protein
MTRLNSSILNVYGTPLTPVLDVVALSRQNSGRLLVKETSMATPGGMYFVCLNIELGTGPTISKLALLATSFTRFENPVFVVMSKVSYVGSSL